ncbi:melatonin receptor type 1C-like [Protopterus annectens]|uniref:melatonin receptor type 1C-like n=1 Tax=Protopterus annectens TaxID=7888 RepID=UPI001CF9E1F5|nr:melatonin receptor type 1C-like [Protopterus annectens]
MTSADYKIQPYSNETEIISIRPVRAVLSVVLIVVIVLDVVGNVLLILSVFRNSKLRNTGNFLVVNLSVSDLLIAVYHYPLTLRAMFFDGWTLAFHHCFASGFIMALSVVGADFSITVIAINRYFYICHSKIYSRIFNVKLTCCWLGLIWFFTFLALIPHIFFNTLQYDPRIYSCTLAQTVSLEFTFAAVIIHFVFPIIIVVVCYLRIWSLAVAAKNRVSQGSKEKLRAHALKHFFSIFVVFVIFAFCWGPMNFIGLAIAISPNKVAPNIPFWLFCLSYYMAYFNSCLNGVLYGVLNQKFQKEYIKIFMSLCTVFCAHVKR